MSSTPKIFGREPVVVGSAIEALLALLIAFHSLAFIGIDSAEAEAVVMAVVFAVIGVYVAAVTHDTLLGAVLAAAKAFIALAAFYHYSLSQDQIATILAAITMGVGFFGHRAATGPTDTPSLDLSQHSPPVATVNVNGVYTTTSLKAAQEE